MVLESSVALQQLGERLLLLLVEGLAELLGNIGNEVLQVRDHL